jgi:hypothetical protein
MMKLTLVRVKLVIILIHNHQPCKPYHICPGLKLKATTTHSLHESSKLDTRQTSVSLAEEYEARESRETSVVMGRRSSTSPSVSPWEDWLEQGLQALQSFMLLRSLRPLAPSEVVAVAGGGCKSPPATGADTPSFQTFQCLGTWDRAAVEVEVSHATFQCWNQESPSTGSFVAWSSSSRCYLSLCLGFFFFFGCDFVVSVF